MRVISGSAGGQHLESPKNLEIRPTPDRVRESLFNILAPRLEGCRFLDLYSGTGANGIEALSRGASWCTFVDESRQASELISQNLVKTGLARSAKVLHKRLPEALARIAQSQEPFDIVFADPPYRYTGHLQLLEAIRGANLLADNGLFILEHHQKQDLDLSGTGWELMRTKKYGDTVLTFLETE